MNTAHENVPALGTLASVARVSLYEAATALESMPNLTRFCDGARLLVKRDDSNGLAFGGNKVRQLEYYLGQARTRNADTLLITGAVQSNFVRLAAAAACRLGMGCHIQLEERVAKDDSNYRNNGNVLLDRLLGATLHHYPDGEDETGADRRLHELADTLSARGHRPYVIPLAPGHPPLGALGYVRAAVELLGQIGTGGPAIDEIVVASGSGNTHAGLLFGLRALGSPIRVTGVCVRRAASLQSVRIRNRCAEIAALLGVDTPVAEDDVQLTDAFLAPGYGLAGESTLEAIFTAARTEALMLDPTYTGKTMAAFMERARLADSERTLLFLHTGGTPALFAYADLLTAEGAT